MVALWFFTFCGLWLSLRALLPWREAIAFFDAEGREQRALSRVRDLLGDWKESLESGILPDSREWQRLEALPAPWSTLVRSSVHQLREQGAPLVPLFSRLIRLVSEQAEFAWESRAKAAQPMAQAWVCTALVPLTGVVLWWILPGVDLHPWLWGGVVTLASVFSMAGALWMVRLAESARWGGLDPRRRPWFLLTFCTGEALVSLVRSGLPAEQAWQLVLQSVSRSDPRFVEVMGATFWQENADSDGQRGASKMSDSRLLSALSDWWAQLRTGLRASVWEGRPSVDRLETALSGLRVQSRAIIDRDLLLVGTRALQPLFLCTAPAVLGLLGVGLGLAWSSAGGFAE